jgi:hypothetical protein
MIIEKIYIKLVNSNLMHVFKNCSANEIEDEAHFLIKCDKLNNKTDELFKLISSKVKNFTKLSNNQKLYYILTCINNVLTNQGPSRGNKLNYKYTYKGERVV